MLIVGDEQLIAVLLRDEEVIRYKIVCQSFFSLLFSSSQLRMQQFYYRHHFDVVKAIN